MLCDLLNATLLLLRDRQIVQDTDQLRGAIGMPLNRQHDTLEAFGLILDRCREEAATVDVARKLQVLCCFRLRPCDPLMISLTDVLCRGTKPS